MIRKNLKNLGLSDIDTSIYLSCLALGQVPVSSIAKKCGINRTTAYAILDKLCQKGFLTKLTRNSTRYYSAIDPLSILEHLKAEKQNAIISFETILPLLKQLRDKSPGIKVEFYQGKEGIKCLYEKILNLRSDIDSFEENGEMFSFIPQYVDYFVKTRMERNIVNRVICNPQSKVNIPSEKELREVRYVDSNLFPFTWDLKICKNLVGIFSFQESEPVAIAILNEDIANNFRVLFNLLWQLLAKNGNKR